jgi:hypothetical protein
MDRYFYIVEEYNGHKEIHFSGNVYFNDSGETEEDFRLAQWTGLYMTVDELKKLIHNYDAFYDYLNERVAYLDDITEKQAISVCQEYFGGTPGTELDIGLVDEDTPCGDYWFE